MTTTTDWSPEVYSFLYEKAELVARTVAREYPNAEIDDLLQESLMWAVAHPGALQGYLDHEDPDQTGRLVFGAMRNASREFAVKQRALARGDETLIDDCWYSTEVLKGFGRGSGQRGLLHLVFEQDAWLNPEVASDDPGVRTKKDPAEGGNWLATLADVSAALDKLSRNDPEAHSLLVLHYKQQYTYDEIGAAMQPAVSRASVSRKIDRAVRKLQDLLGGPEPRKDPAEPGWNDGPGSRWVLSNAQARAITDNVYDD